MKKLILIVLLTVVAALAVVNHYFPEKMVQGMQLLSHTAAGLKHKTVKVGAYNYHYLDSGNENKPVLLMIHGFTADKDGWPAIAASFKKNYRVVALDLLGHGQSDRPMNESYRISAQTERVHAFAQALQLGKLHLMGNSMGGHIAGVYAARYPDEVLSATLLNNAGIESPELSDMFVMLQKDSSRHPLIPTKPEDGHKLFDFLFVNPPPTTARVREFIAGNTAKHVDLYYKIFDDIARGGFESFEKDLPNIKAPMLVIWGDQDRVLHVSTMDVMKKHQPNARYVVMKDVGHLPMMESPKTTAEIFNRFISDNF